MAQRIYFLPENLKEQHGNCLADAKLGLSNMLARSILYVMPHHTI